MSESRDRESRYAMLADAVEAGDYRIVDGSVSIREDYRPGRPRTGDIAEQTRPMAVRLTDSDRRRLADYAERTGQSMSTIIRTALNDYLDSHPAA